MSQIGDIPEAEAKPPDNVLFVCKLNPVTEVNDIAEPNAFLYAGDYYVDCRSWTRS